jgi:hypothetical protein
LSSRVLKKKEFSSVASGSNCRKGHKRTSSVEKPTRMSAALLEIVEADDHLGRRLTKYLPADFAIRALELVHKDAEVQSLPGRQLGGTKKAEDPGREGIAPSARVFLLRTSARTCSWARILAGDSFGESSAPTLRSAAPHDA